MKTFLFILQYENSFLFSKVLEVPTFNEMQFYLNFNERLSEQ